MILAPSTVGPGQQAIDPTCVLSPAFCIAKAAGGAAVRAVGSSVFDAFSSWLAGGASWLVGQVFSVVVGSDAPHSNNPASVTLSAGWFVQKDALMLGIAVVVLLPLLLAATIGAILRQDLGRLARTWLVGLPVAVVFSIVSVAATDLAVHLCDDLCQMVLKQSGSDMVSFFVRLAAAPAEGSIPTVITALLCVLLLVGAVLLWLEMLMRATAIYIAAFFLPLALAGLVWPATSKMMKRLAEVLVALVFSKFVVVATLALGMGAAASASGVAAAVTGGAIMLLAAFAPMILLRLIPVVEVATIDHMGHMGRRSIMGAFRGANEVASMPQSPLARAMREQFGGGRHQAEGGQPSGGMPGLADRKGDVFPATMRMGGTGGGGVRTGAGVSGAGAGAGAVGAAASAATKVGGAVGKQAVGVLPAVTDRPRSDPETGDAG